MDNATAQRAAELTAQFYAEVADSFSETRVGAWPGWQGVLDAVSAQVGSGAGAAETALSAEENSFDVLDMACGNLRFEKFLQESGVPVRSVCAVDNCPQFVIGNRAGEGEKGSARGEGALGSFPFPVRFRQIDILGCADVSREIYGCRESGSGESRVPDTFERTDVSHGTFTSCGSGADDGDRGDSGAFDLAVCFGFMHHVPRAEQRRELLRVLVRATRPGGMVAVSFWQFANSERLLRKAEAATARGARLHGIRFSDENDHLLGWQDEQNVFRYCHNYTEEEIDGLVAAIGGEGVQQVARFSADGETGNLNRYIVLKVEGL